MRATPAPQAIGDRQQLLPLFVVAGALVTLAFVWVMLVGTYAQYAAFLIGGALVMLTIPIARHAARIEAWPGLSSLMMLAMILRIGGSLARYAVAYGAYGGVADASTYTGVANADYKAFRQLHWFTPDTSVFHGLVPWLDTVIYALFGPTEMGAFLIFGWLNFIGTYLFFRAFRIGFPAGDFRRYAVLVFFLPSLLYWPSSLGKEAWMMLTIGLASYGLARVLAGRPAGYAALLLGIGGMLLVRPHLALIFLPAALFALVFRQSRAGRQVSIYARVTGIAVLVVASFFVIAKAQSYFGITSLDVQTVTKQLQTTRQQTALGNSAFSPPNAQSPTGFFVAIVTVLFRPFPFEAHGLTVLVASLEGLILLAVSIGSWRRLTKIPAALRASPYVLFSIVYSMLFVFAFSNFSNFGILARERVQMFPLLLVLLAVVAPDGPERVQPVHAPSPARRRQLPSYTTSSRLGARTRAAGDAGSYQAFGYQFRVKVEHSAATFLRAAVAWSFEGLARPAGPADEHVYQVTPSRTHMGMVRLERDGHVLAEEVSAAAVLVAMMTDINGRAFASRPDRLNIHAAALSVGGKGLLMPAASGSGKSTLGGALVIAGCNYLSDEAASIDLGTGMVEPYPKPISLAPSSQAILGCSPGEHGPTELIPASWLRPGSYGHPIKATTLVFPTFHEGSASQLSTLSRAEALVELANNSFNFVDHGSAWLPGLRDLVADCACWRIIFGDPHEAASLILDRCIG